MSWCVPGAACAADACQSRFATVRTCLEDATLDPLDDADTLEAELAQFSVVARFQYHDTFAILHDLFEPAASAFVSATTLDPGTLDYRAAEGSQPLLFRPLC